MGSSNEHLNINESALAAALREGYGDQQVKFDETGQVIIPNTSLVVPEFTAESESNEIA